MGMGPYRQLSLGAAVIIAVAFSANWLASASPRTAPVTPVQLSSGDSVQVSCGTQLSIQPNSDKSVTVFCGVPSTDTPTLTGTPTETSTEAVTSVPPTVPPSPTTLPTATSVPPTPAPSSSSLWLSPGEIAALPTSGAAWTSVQNTANGSWGSPDLANLNSLHDTNTLAGALVYARIGGESLRQKVADAIVSAVGTESGSRSLETSRNIVSYVIAADLIDFRSFDPVREAQWRTWLAALRSKTLDGKTIISTQETRPNNWGTMAGAARVAIDRYIGDNADLARAATVFHGWLGDRSSYSGFDYGELSWQCNPTIPVGINPVDCTKDGHNTDGVLPDDQRRTGGFAWPAPKGSYPHEALQGAFVEAELLTRAGYPAWTWEESALRRAYVWLYDINNNPPGGDDSGYPFLVNKAYGTSFKAGSSPSSAGKNMCCLAWTHGS